MTVGVGAVVETTDVETTEQFELTSLRHRRLAADTELPELAPLWLTVLSGQVDLETADGVLRLEPGDAVWIDGRTAHRITAVRGAEVATADLRASTSPRQLPSPLVVREFARRHVGVAGLTRTCPLDDGCRPSAFAKGYGNLLGAAMVDSWRQDHGLDTEEPGDPVIVTVVAAVTAEPARPWTAASMAELVHLSRSTLGDRFRKSLGRSPVTALREIRMGEARRLLTDPSHPVEYVASRVGYGSLAAFSRAFTGHHGRSPQAWRAQLRAAGTREGSTMTRA